MASALKIFAALLPLSWKQNIQNTKLILIRIGAVIVQACLLVSIFNSVGRGKPVPKRVALLTYGVIHLSMMALMKTLDLFARERSAVMRKQMQCNYYSIKYILTQVVAKILPGIRGSPEDIGQPMNMYDNSDQDLLLVDGVLRIHGLCDSEFHILR